MTQPDDLAPRATLAIVYGPLAHEQPIALLEEAAAGLCDIVWVLPRDDRATRTALRVRRAETSATDLVLNVSDLSLSDAVELIRSHAPQGIVCFTDENIGYTADLAHWLGLSFHQPSTAMKLTDKLAQRASLARAGLPTPAFWDVDDLMNGAASVSSERMSFPLVLKPRRGFGSIDTESVPSATALALSLNHVAPGRMILEGFIPDPTESPFGEGSAPYVCVDVIARDGRFDVVAMTGRTPLAPPFRETGSFFPADAPDSVRRACAEAALAALDALGVTVGVLRVEVKWTDTGPVVIEVNGRPDGGNTREFLRRALHVDTFRIAMQLALGHDVELATASDTPRVHFRFDLVPDIGLRRIESVSGLDDVRAISGVEQVIEGLRAGDEFSWRDGSFSLVATVLGTAPDHEAVRRIRVAVYAAVTVSGI